MLAHNEPKIPQVQSRGNRRTHPPQISEDTLNLSKSGSRLCPPHATPFPRIFRPSYGPKVQNIGNNFKTHSGTKDHLRGKFLRFFFKKILNISDCKDEHANFALIQKCAVNYFSGKGGKIRIIIEVYLNQRFLASIGNIEKAI